MPPEVEAHAGLHPGLNVTCAGLEAGWARQRQRVCAARRLALARPPRLTRLVPAGPLLLGSEVSEQALDRLAARGQDHRDATYSSGDVGYQVGYRRDQTIA